MPDLLEVDHLVVRRGTKFALAPISFSLTDQSGIVGLFGQNGAGKTTLLKALAGLLRHQGGTISSLGDQRPVFLPDHPYLYDFLRVGECATLLGRYFADFSVEVADEIVTDLGLDRGKRLSQLSKGMAEQLSLGMMLARRGQVYLFDEPLAAVDPLTRETLVRLIHRHRPAGAAVVISTHLISGLEELFDQFMVMHEGALLLHEPVSELAVAGGLEETFKKAVRSA